MLERVEEVMKEMKSNGFLPYTSHFTMLIKLYGARNMIEKVEEIMNEMKMNHISPDTPLYTALIKAFGENDRMDKVEELIKQMRVTKFRFTILMYETLIKVYGEKNSIEKVEEIFKEMKKEGIQPNTNLYFTLLKVYQENNEITRVERIVEKMKKEKMADFRAYTMLFRAYSAVGKVHKWKEIIPEMKANNIQMDVGIFNAILQAYVDNEVINIDDIEEIMNQMKVQNIQPSTITHAHLIHAYLNAGMISKAQNVLDAIGREMLEYLEMGSTVPILKEMMKRIKSHPQLSSHLHSIIKERNEI